MVPLRGDTVGDAGLSASLTLMARLYSMLHPSGASAVGVATLRLAVAALVLAAFDTLPVVGPAVTCVAWLCAIALAAGILTRPLALIVAAAALLLWRHAAGAPTGVLVVGGLAALALALIGAGALSVDAHLFGRRVIDLGE